MIKKTDILFIVSYYLEYGITDWLCVRTQSFSIQPEHTKSVFASFFLSINTFLLFMC